MLVALIPAGPEWVVFWVRRAPSRDPLRSESRARLNHWWERVGPAVRWYVRLMACAVKGREWYMRLHIEHSPCVKVDDETTETKCNNNDMRMGTGGDSEKECGFSVVEISPV